VLGDSMNNNLRNFAIKIARENPQLKTLEKINELSIKKAGDRGATREIYRPVCKDFYLDHV
jgi:hypothetical protein